MNEEIKYFGVNNLNGGLLLSHLVVEDTKSINLLSTEKETLLLKLY
jgi:hypothetical protein